MTQLTTDVAPAADASPFDKSNPRALFNLLPKYIQDRMEEIPEVFFESTEEEIRQQLFGGNSPDQTLNRLRVSFWEEYDRVQRYKEPKLDIAKVVEGVCLPRYFMTKILPIDAKLVWLLHAPTDYQINLREMHELSLRQMRNVMALPIVDPATGKINTKLIEVQNKIFTHVDMRIKGAIIQRIDQRNLNVNLEGEAAEAKAKEIAEGPKRQESMAEIDARLSNVRQRIELLSAPSLISADLSPAAVEPERILNQSESVPIALEAELVDEKQKAATPPPVDDSGAR
jgi:hypothetical protein